MHIFPYYTLLAMQAAAKPGDSLQTYAGPPFMREQTIKIE